MKNSLAGYILGTAGSLLLLGGGAAPALASQNYSLDSILSYSDQAMGKFREIQVIYDKFKRIYKGALAESSTPKDPAFDKLAQALDGMEAPWQALQGDVDKFKATGAKVRKLYGENEIIDSNDARWTALQALIKEMEADGNDFQKDGNALNGALQNYQNVANQAEIGEESTKNLVADVDKRLAWRTNWIERFHKIQKSASTLKLKGEADQESYRLMKGYAEKAQGELELFQKIGMKFKASAQAKDFVYSGPGIPSTLVSEEMAEKGKRMDGFFQQFKKEYIRIAGSESAWDKMTAVIDGKNK